VRGVGKTAWREFGMNLSYAYVLCEAVPHGNCGGEEEGGLPWTLTQRRWSVDLNSSVWRRGYEPHRIRTGFLIENKRKMN
jgi:hypothetical protein